MAVTITVTELSVIVHVPFDETFRAQAKQLKGVFKDETQTWRFDPRDEARVRQLCKVVYGTDGRDDADEAPVTVRVPVPNTGDREFRLAGLRLVRRRHKTEPPVYGEGVILISGGFASEGGSLNNPRLEPLPGTIIEVRDLPRGTAELILSTARGAQLAGQTDQLRDSLLEERERLAKRLHEIDNVLATLGKE